MKKVLLCGAQPVGETPIRYDSEVQAIRDAVDKAGKTLQIESVLAATADDLMDAITKHQPDVLHLSVHGNRDGLLLDTGTGGSHLVRNAAIVQLVAACASIRIVMLNACYTEPLAELLREHVDVVIGMRDTINSNTAVAFGSRFYYTLASGESVDTSFRRSLASLSMHNLPNQDAPQLLCRSGIDSSQMVLGLPHQVPQDTTTDRTAGTLVIGSPGAVVQQIGSVNGGAVIGRMG